jgi:hypothetical protein
MKPRANSRFCGFCTLHPKVKLPIGGSNHASDRVVSRRTDPPIGSAITHGILRAQAQV